MNRSRTVRIAFTLSLTALLSGSLFGLDEKAVLEAWKRLPVAERAFQVGLKKFESKHPEGAAKDFERCLGEVPEHAFARYYLANLAYMANDMPKALDLMNRAIADLDFMEALNEYALAQKSRAFDSYAQMMAQEWDSTGSCRTHRELESLYGEISDAKSKQEIQQAAQRAARSRQRANYHYFLGNILFQLQRFDQAAAAYERAVGLDPRHASAANNLAAIFYAAGDAGQALSILERAEGQGLEDNLNLKLKHLVMEALGRPTAGILQEELAAGPNGETGVVRLALAFKSGDPRLPPLYENGYLLFSRSTRAAVLIDPGVEDSRIDEQVKSRGLAVKAILYTHGHSDHVAAGPLYARRFAAPVQAKAEEAKDLPAAPSRTFADGEVLSFDGLTVKVLATPGHSPGSVSFLAGDVLFSGDTLFKGGIGVISTWDEPTARNFAAEMVRGIKERLLVLPDATVVCPGHGKTTTIGAEKASNPFLKR